MTRSRQSQPFVRNSGLAASTFRYATDGLRGPSLAVTLLLIGSTLPAFAQGAAGPTGAAPALPPPLVANPLNEPLWVAVNGQATGPFDPQTVTQKVASRDINGDTMVYMQSTGRWLRAADVPVLQQLIANQVPPPPPVPVPPAAPMPPTGGQPVVPPGGQPMPPAQPSFDDRAKQIIIGEWMTDIPSPAVPGVSVRTSIIYGPDMSYRGYQMTLTTMPGFPEPQIMNSTPLNGQWKVQGLDDRRFLLTLTGGATATVSLEIMDNNHLRNNEMGYIAQRVGG